MFRIVVLLSGSGSNLQALIHDSSDAHTDTSSRPSGKYQIAAVVSNIEHAYGLERARRAGIPAFYIPHDVPDTHADIKTNTRRHSKPRAVFEQEIIDTVVDHMGTLPDLWVLAGFMRVVSGHFLQQTHGKVINIHPSLLPHFRGMHAVSQALAQSLDDPHTKTTGCTVHWVDAGVDTGPIIAQMPVPILPDDDEKMLHARIQVREHQLLPLVVRMFAGRAGY